MMTNFSTIVHTMAYTTLTVPTVYQNGTTDNVTTVTEEQTTEAEHARSGYNSLQDYPEYAMSLDMYPVHTWLFVIAGMIGNLLALIVICQKNMRGMSSSIFVMALSIADNIALVGFLLGMYSLIYAQHIIVNEFCMAYFFLLSVGSMISAWTVAAMSFERVLIVTFPLKAPTWTSRKKAIIMEITIVFFIVLHNIHFFWTAMVSPVQVACEYDYLKYGTFLGKWSIYDACMSSYIPLCLIICLNIIIIVQMSRARNIQKKMSSNGTQNGSGAKGGKGSSAASATNQITVMLLSVSVAFFICMTPYAIFQIYINEYLDFTTISAGEYAKVALGNQWCLIFWELNHSINVILYSLTGRKFRNNMLKLFTCGAYEDRPQSKSYASETIQTTNVRAANGKAGATSVTTVSGAV